jgi:drug/metabolite transporter (DMT)-like permease
MSTVNKRERTGAGLAAGSVLLVGGSVAASSLLDGYPVLGGQAVRYLAAGILLAAWARLQRKPLPRPAGREWAWLAALAAIGLAGCSVLMIQATRVADPASVGVIIGAAPLVIIIAAAITAGRRPNRQILLAAAVVTAGSAAAQLGGATGPTWSPAGLLWSAGALVGVVGSSLLAAPLLPRLGALAVTTYACGLAGILLLATAAVTHIAGGPPILRMPTATQLAALAYLTIAITALVFIAWYGAMERLGVDRTGLFNGLIPVTSLAAVTLTGTGTITPPRLLGALAVLAGVLLGLSRGPGPANSRTSSNLSAPVISSSLATTGCGRASTSLPCFPCSARAARTRTRTLAESRNDSPDASTVTCRAPVSSCAASISRSTVAVVGSASPDSTTTGPSAPADAETLSAAMGSP